MNAFDLRQSLASQAEEVCRHLLPGGKRTGSEWCSGDLNGGSGRSLKVHLDGTKAGLWCDFADAGKKGSLIDLWMEVKGLSFPNALKEIREWLGLPPETAPGRVYGAKTKNQYQEPTRKGLGALEAGDPVLKYLTEDRKIPHEIVQRYQIARTADSGAIAYPYFAGPALCMLKFLALERPEGKKRIWASPNPRKVLFGKPACSDHSGELIIAEGETEALTWAALGKNAVSVPFGAKWGRDKESDPNSEWISNDWDWLENFQTIYLAFDRDEEGQKACDSVSKRLGQERCMTISFPEPYKDANEIWMDGKPELLLQALQNAEEISHPSLICATDCIEDVWDKFDPEKEEPGHQFLFGIPFYIRRREVTIWTGFSGSGKSELLSMFLVYMTTMGERVCIASAEGETLKMLRNMTIQAIGRVPQLSERALYDETYSQIANHIWIVNNDGNLPWKELMETFLYARRRYSIDQFAIDSLLFCGITGDDYEGQRNFIQELASFAKREAVHIHLVAHSRKRLNEYELPGKMDVSGSADITNPAHNGLTVWRNKKKEDMFWENQGNPAKLQEIAQIHDTELKIWKQRETGVEPHKRLYFVPAARQFHTEPLNQGVKMA